MKDIHTKYLMRLSFFNEICRFHTYVSVYCYKKRIYEENKNLYQKLLRILFKVADTIISSKQHYLCIITSNFLRSCDMLIKLVLAPFKDRSFY